MHRSETAQSAIVPLLTLLLLTPLSPAAAYRFVTVVPGAFWNVTVSVRQCRSALSDCEVQRSRTAGQWDRAALQR